MTALLEKTKTTPRALSIFDQLRSEMDRMFESTAFSGPGFLAWRNDMAFVPALEVAEKDHALVITADLPGLKKEDVAVAVTPEGVAITGERKEETQEKKEGYFRTERRYGAFERFVPLPEGAVVADAVAAFKDGVLEVKVPLGAAPTPEVRRLPIE